jgi:hypothetical protein
MKSIVIYLSIFMLCCPTSKTYAQPDFSEDPYFYSKYTFEIGMSVGVMNCLTDLGGNKGIGKKFIKDLNLGNTTPSSSIYLGFAYKNAYVLRTEATWGIVKASDDVLKSKKETTSGRFERNLSFRSTIFEISLTGEIHPRYFKRYLKGDQLPRFSPYVFGGIGYFVFNPQADLMGTKVDLRPLRTEGQGFEEYPDRKLYKLKQINFPVGAGVKYKYSSLLNFSAEFMYRFLSTDYLDDVSKTYINKNLFKNYLTPELTTQANALYNRQKEINPSAVVLLNGQRGNPNNNDAYFSINFKVGIVF